ncbi:hypothetical protein DSO57_1019169 [Entomophthora muscae]|uniref:Uncharacterized protein n=1 Tax=Entomophthora muscae TaxID=34485 RepID=A0ACC2RVC0_9FUNG|nr:hypothetical protein DSO57_1019169 [Entomophthora muscae]
MTLPLTPQPDRPMETLTAAETTSTQLFGVLYITLTGMIDTMVPNSGPWSLLGQYVSYIIKLAPILWWALPSGPAIFQPKPTNASTYAWLHDTAPKTEFVTKVTILMPQAVIEPASSHQAGLVGRGDSPSPGFLLFKANPGVGTIPALVVAVGPILSPKSYAQALVGLDGPGQANFSCPVNPVQAHPPFSNLGSSIGDPFFYQVPWSQESLSSQPKKGDQIGKNPITPEAKPARTNGQPSQDGPSKSQTTVPETPKNDHEAANQTSEPDMSSLAIQIAPEKCPEALACE